MSTSPRLRKQKSAEIDGISIGQSSGIDRRGRRLSYDEPHHSHHHGRRVSQENRDEFIEKKQRKVYESKRVMFILGTVLGLALTVLFSTTNAPSEVVNNFNNLNFFEDWKDWSEWKDLLPSGLQSLLQEAESPDDGLHGSAESFSVGQRLAMTKNFTQKYNVIMVPGVISTGLQSWSTTNYGSCPSISHFRKRMWGSFYMLKMMILDKTCWLKHIMLDQETGLDPPGIKLRAAEGFEASDFFMPGYWIWNKILQNLAVIGYSPDNMISAAYDWRLTYIDLEKRDKYFSKLKAQIELTVKHTGEKSILVGHSMGSQIIFYFMKWVEASGKDYGNGGKSWVNDHIAAFVDISGSTLGTPKTISALLSGEMKDTVQLNALAVYGLEQFFSRRERVDMLRTFGGIAGMLPKGGELIWGNLTYAPDDPVINEFEPKEVLDANSSNRESFGTFFKYNHKDGHVTNATIDEAIDKMLDVTPEWYTNRVRDNYSWGVARTASEIKANNQDQRTWSNPLEAELPNAPDMKIYCFYGVGKPTERAYTYTEADKSVRLPYIIDPLAETPVYFSDGDGTVSLLTHTMCHEWKKGSESRFNPAGIEVKIVEIKHEPDRFDIRGGAKTAEHVDILGSAELNELVLTVASGKGDTITDRYVSNLKQIVEGLNI
ncbi:uncharacterized protein SPAPADRAFT_132946 [Spathaspora passalidarum NRRL Y-27907]|uniref:Phospholipid:diacylglycerol acyltransferase n=1 Tax=Spathaspora passalidarum (strain NRRL Y-27907 / 11-Y1) TaxID=619300 RepID=G3AEH9_SPAPN|nr:uncharacterized protein SPAPADRAFT_132946 [Spathaspora passalidarum NRRL Y-27907]EGW34741.1 hypothetical protein SPAPADRAFT_132946 [Spathaspora passalidarum NRRL Y-27907]